MLHVWYSNRTEALLQALVRNVRDERARAGAFAPLRLVVPNRNVETYVKLGLAEASGIAANIEVTFLRRLLTRVAERALPDARVVDARQTEAFLLVALHDEALMGEPVLAPVRAYLLGAGETPDAIDRRRCQLAALLGQLYDEYAGSRPELLAGWREGRANVDGADEARGTEAWQRALWRAVFARDGLCARRAQAEGISLLTLPELLAAAEARGTLDARGLLPGLHVFGVSYVGRSYHRMLAAIGRQIDVHVYTLNPCREFWEDVESRAELRRRLKKQGRAALFPSRTEGRQPGLALGDDPYGLLGESENLALRLWGRPGRENVRLLNDSTGGDFHGLFVARGEPGGASGMATLLGRLQDDILDRAASEGPDPALRADGSLRLLPCPGLRRELEVVAAEIWRLVREDPTLRFHDIAVVVPEAKRDLYLSHVSAVFAEAHDLPHSVVDLPLGAGQRLGEAIDRLLTLPFGSFSRRELLPLLTHPALTARFPDADPQRWVRLCDELGIFHGADRDDHQGTYIERDLLNWDQGIRRAVLGALMTGAPSGDDSPVVVDGQEYLPLERPADEVPGALGFALLVRSLLADARFAAGKTGPRLRPCAQWFELIRGMLAGYLVPADQEEQSVLARALAEIEELEALAPLDVTPVSYRVAVELTQRALGGLGGARGQLLARGVSVASFVPMRAIPFRTIFVLGLGQGDFPRATPPSPLDLRGARRLPGDVTAREQDLYMFLETLLCARDRLVVSYVARDELTGERLEPSSVLLELREILAQGYLAPAEIKALFEGEARPPLRRHEDEARVPALPTARREWVARALGRSLRAALPAGVRLPDLPTLRRSLPPAVFAQVSARLGALAPPARQLLDGAPDRLTVPLAAIRQFLEDPLQGSARFRLRLREVEGEEELVDRGDEPFETDRPSRSLLLRRAMVAALVGGEAAPSWERVAARHAALGLYEELRGRLPTGFFRSVARPGEETILRGWLDDVTALANGGSLGARVVRFGRGGGDDEVGEVLDPIVLTIEAPEGFGSVTLTVELIGQTELLVTPASGPGSILFAVRKELEDKRVLRDRLRGFIDHLALAAAGFPEGPHQAFVAWSNGPKHELASARFRPVSAEAARAYLGKIVREMLTGARDASGYPTGVHPYLLPCEAVFLARTSKGRKDVHDAVEELRDLYLERPFLSPLSSLFGPVPEAVERHDPPPSAEADRLAEERFGLFFALLEGGEEGEE